MDKKKIDTIVLVISTIINTLKDTDNFELTYDYKNDHIILSSNSKKENLPKIEQYTAKYKKKNILKGLCRSCTKPLFTKNLCKEHRDKQIEYRKQYRRHKQELFRFN